MIFPKAPPTITPAQLGTAMLAANGLLIKRDSAYMLAVPVEGHDRDVFVRGLGRWYVHGDDEVVGWLAEWNLTNPD